MEFSLEYFCRINEDTLALEKDLKNYFVKGTLLLYITVLLLLCKYVHFGMPWGSSYSYQNLKFTIH
jgi:hypothetical protein